MCEVFHKYSFGKNVEQNQHLAMEQWIFNLVYQAPDIGIFYKVYTISNVNFLNSKFPWEL